PGLRVAETSAGLVATLAPEEQLARAAEMIPMAAKDASDMSLVLELRNTSPRQLRVCVAGPQAELSLEMRGPGAASLPVIMEPEPQPRIVTLDPGESWRLVTRLPNHNRVRLAVPGNYTVTARLVTSASAPGMPPRRITVQSAPLTIHVDAP